MAGGGQMQNPYQQVGRGGRGGMRQMAGMNPNQPILQRQIGTMGPGVGMAPTQTGLGAQGTLVPPSMGMAPMQGQMPQQVPQADPRMEYMKQLYSGQASAAARPGSGMASMLDAQINDRRLSSLQNPTYQPMPQQMPQQTTNTRYLGELSTVPPEYRAQEEALRAYAAQRQQMPQGGVPLDMVYRGGPQMPQQGPQNLQNYQAMMQMEQLARMQAGQQMPQQQQQLPQTGGGMQQPPVMGLGGLGIAGLQRI